MGRTSYRYAPRQHVPHMNKRIVLESYKAACLLLDWVTTLAAEDPVYEPLPSQSNLERWALVDYLSRPEVVSYDQIGDRERLLQLMAGLEVALMLSARKDESFAIRREWKKLAGWLRDTHHIDPAVQGISFINIILAEENADITKAMVFMIEHMPELRSGWSEGGADALNDYLYVLWLDAKEGMRFA